jgi:hypothetical protein
MVLVGACQPGRHPNPAEAVDLALLTRVRQWRILPLTWFVEDECRVM